MMAALLRRYLADQTRTDLERKMVFVSGPRQVGKTTLARGLLPDPAGYLSWDIPDHRDAILRGPAATQISAAGPDDYRTPEGIRVQPAIPFLRSLV